MTRKLLAALPLLVPMCLLGEQVQEISQYGITWKFDKPYEAGRFVTGDWWVVGPVTITEVTPKPGPAGDAEPDAVTKSRYGASALSSDRSMRHGSMILGEDVANQPLGSKDPNPGASQGYDSRPGNYDARLSVAFPAKLEPGRSLISTVSSETYAPDRKGEIQLSTPNILGENGIFLTSKTSPLALRAAAVLTCLPEAPPSDAFRPPYGGKYTRLYRESELQWDRLPKLAAPESTPDWAKMERIFERPWLDHLNNWMIQYTLPGENQPAYGREFARLTSIGGIMLLLDEPRERKRKLMIHYVQLGLDLHGLARGGRQWFSDGGHWQGRKWPILFASLMLDSVELRTFPAVDPARPVYGRFRLDASAAPTTTLFQEDIDTYYGRGGDGQKVLWQIGTHTGAKPPHEEKPRAEWTKAEQFVDAYKPNNASSWLGYGLAAQQMKAKAVWNHDAFFDFLDRWMSPEEAYDPPKWSPKGCTRSMDLFLEDMWRMHRPSVPAQPGGQDNLKWVWTESQQGKWIPNPKE
jgi:hypothetical protein